MVVLSTLATGELSCTVRSPRDAVAVEVVSLTVQESDDVLPCDLDSAGMIGKIVAEDVGAVVGGCAGQ